MGKLGNFKNSLLDGCLSHTFHLGVVLATPGGGLGDVEKIELNHDAIGVFDEQLVQVGFGKMPRPEADIFLLKPLYK